MLKKSFLLAIAAVLVSLVLSRLPLKTVSQKQYAPSDARYTVSVYRGMVAAYRRSETQPFQVLYSYVDALPAGMKEKLHTGIPARNEKELVRILEEYSS